MVMRPPLVARRAAFLYLGATAGSDPKSTGSTGVALGVSLGVSDDVSEGEVSDDGSTPVSGASSPHAARSRTREAPRAGPIARVARMHRVSHAAMPACGVTTVSA